LFLYASACQLDGTPRATSTFCQLMKSAGESCNENKNSNEPHFYLYVIKDNTHTPLKIDAI
jgi:hypothetical protein